MKQMSGNALVSSSLAATNVFLLGSRPQILGAA
jgi:hypothetical protein